MKPKLTLISVVVNGRRAFMFVMGTQVDQNGKTVVADGTYRILTTGLPRGTTVSIGA